MKDYIDKFYEATKELQPNDNVKYFISLNKKSGKAVDLGCGAGRDTVFLIKNGWEVIGIDSKNTEHYIRKKLDKNEGIRFKFVQEKFEEVNIEKNDLVVANNSISFCSKYYFKDLWNKIKESLNNNRIFCWNIVWRKR